MTELEVWDRVAYQAENGHQIVLVAPYGLVPPPTIEMNKPWHGPITYVYQGQSQEDVTPDGD